MPEGSGFLASYACLPHGDLRTKPTTEQFERHHHYSYPGWNSLLCAKNWGFGSLVVVTFRLLVCGGDIDETDRRQKGAYP